MTTLAEKIAVMQAAERGEKIEVTPRHGCNMGRWFPCPSVDWNWSYYEYRIAPRELKIWVCEYNDNRGKRWVTNIDPSTWHVASRRQINVLSEQTITF